MNDYKSSLWFLLGWAMCWGLPKIFEYFDEEAKPKRRKRKRK